MKIVGLFSKIFKNKAVNEKPTVENVECKKIKELNNALNRFLTANEYIPKSKYRQTKKSHRNSGR